MTEQATPVNPGQQLLIEMTVAMGVLANEIRLLRASLKKSQKSADTLAVISDSIAGKLDTVDLTMEILYKNARSGMLSLKDFVNFYAEAAAEIERENGEEPEEEEEEDDGA
jgi:hypothetical protein